MTKRRVVHAIQVSAGLALLLGLISPAVAEAQVVRVSGSDTRQAVGFNLGYFAVRGEDSRTDGDVLLADLNDLAFQIGDFSGFTFGGEYLFAVSDYLEVGAGLDFYQHTVPSVYREFVDSDGTEIAQDLKLRIVPITATVRFLPVGRSGAVQPYVGAGLGIFNWRYAEFGEFVDFSDDSIFRQRYEKSGSSLGPVILAGLRAPVGDFWSVGGEIRWQSAEGDDLFEDGFLDDKIDLGGWTTTFNFHFRF
ncbi:MAG TPA: outer membrane beta-barrel protein [Vicinamibacterales bacterium]|nr:outer membrane beta-barrel protein [Vicinamibacterales bacterium]